jgi:hypothetical protein
MSTGPELRARYDTEWGPRLVSAPHPPPPRQVSHIATLPGTFLTIPLEIRFNIYRRLLRYHKSLSRNSQNLGLSPAILGTCRQVLNEGRAVLYGENTWRIDIGVFSSGWDDFVLLLFFGRPGSFDLRPVWKFLRRFDLSIIVRCRQDVSLVRNAVGSISQFLSKIPKLDRLHIMLYAGNPGNSHRQRQMEDTRHLSHVLERLSQVRPVQSVIINGVPPFYTDYLTRSMTMSPLSDLQKQYDTVCGYSNTFQYFTALEQAYIALAREDADKLDKLVEEILRRAWEHVTDPGTRPANLQADAVNAWETTDYSGFLTAGVTDGGVDGISRETAATDAFYC